MLSPVESSVTTAQLICIDFVFSFLFNYMASVQVEPDLAASPGHLADLTVRLPEHQTVLSGQTATLHTSKNLNANPTTSIPTIDAHVNQ